MVIFAPVKARDVCAGIRVRQGAFTGWVTEVRLSRRARRLREFTVTWELSHHPETTHDAREAASFTHIDSWGRPWGTSG